MTVVVQTIDHNFDRRTARTVDLCQEQCCYNSQDIITNINIIVINIKKNKYIIAIILIIMLFGFVGLKQRTSSFRSPETATTAPVCMKKTGVWAFDSAASFGCTGSKPGASYANIEVATPGPDLEPVDQFLHSPRCVICHHYSPPSLRMRGPK